MDACPASPSWVGLPGFGRPWWSIGGGGREDDWELTQIKPRSHTKITDLITNTTGLVLHNFRPIDVTPIRCKPLD